MSIIIDINKRLQSLRDENYKNFHSKLMPTVSEDKIIGIKIPILKQYAKEIAKNQAIGEFLKDLPHAYYEENNLHAFIIASEKDYQKCIVSVEEFLPYIDNWATCDSLIPKCFKKNKDKLLSKILVWIKTNHTYTVRFAIKLLMSLYLDENFKEEYLELVSNVRSNEYYVNMMIAWYFQTALTKQYDSAIKYLVDKKLPVWVHNKAIQKSIESFRISEDKKQYLKSLKIR